ncbi:hypothetical protein GCM10023174_22770 [Chelativorans composti]
MLSKQDLKGTFRRSWLSNAGVGVLRVLLLFGSAAVALSLTLAPDSERRVVRQALFEPGIDHFLTGAIGGPAVDQQRSVLRSSLESECIISRDGSKRGRC